MTERQKKETKETRTSVENLTGCGDIVCKPDGIRWHRLQMSVLLVLTYLIESWIYPGCSYEFNVVYVQREKSQYLLYYNNIWSTHVQEQKIKENH